MNRHVALLKSGLLSQGGLEKYTLRIATAFAKKNFQVTLLTTGSPPPLFHPNLLAHTTELFRWPPSFRIEQFDRFVQKWVDKNQPDLIFGLDRNRYQTHLRAGNGVHASYLESRLLTEGRLKYLNCLINPLHRKILKLEKTAFEHPALLKLFTNSHMVKEQILNRFRVDVAKIEVVHNGVEWVEMEADFNAWEAHYKKGGPYRFLFIGNGYQRKGLHPLLEALSRLSRRDFQLTVIGKERHLADYQKKAIFLGLKDKIQFLGPQKEIRRFYQQADALVIPSFYDPFANVTVEALAMGLFVISSRQNGGHEILTPQNGKIIDHPLDLEALTTALEEAMNRPKTKQSAILIRESVKHLDFSFQMPLLMDRL